MWLVTIRGDVILSRYKFVREGKVEKQKLVDHFVIPHDQLISKNWTVHVRRHLRGIDMNQFHDAYDLGLELIGYEMGDGVQFIKL